MCAPISPCHVVYTKKIVIENLTPCCFSELRNITVNVTGHLHTVTIFCRVHGDVTHGGPGVSVCEL